MARTRTVETIIHAVSPLLGTGAAAVAASCAQTGIAANSERPVAPSALQSFLETVIISPLLQRGFAGLAGANAHSLTHIEDENLPIADGARIGGGLSSLH